MNLTEAFKAATETPLDTDMGKMVDKLKTHCGQAVNTYLTNRTGIMRIFEMEANRSAAPDIVIWNGNQSGRTSKNTATYYNEFIGHLCGDFRERVKCTASLLNF